MCPRLIKNSMSVRSYVTFCRDVFSRSLSSGIRPLFALAVAVVFMDSVQAQAQTATGTIEGSVLGTGNGAFLNNARVIIEGTRIEVLTDANGLYRFTNVPAGPVQLRVTYAGMETKTARMNVAAATTARQDFELSIPRDQTTLDDKSTVKLESFVVESTALSAAAAAVNEQKMSPNIKNVIVLDEIGDLGDGNIGE